MFLLRRLLQAVLVLIVISLVAFAVKDQLGDPLREMTGQAVSEAEREALRAELGLNDPWLVQYGRFLRDAVRGKFPVSYHYKESSLKVILKKFPATFELVLLTAILTVLLSVPLGMFVTARPRHPVSTVVLSTSLLGISIPVFLIAILLMFLVEHGLHWGPIHLQPDLPVFGRGETVSVLGWESGLLTWDGWRHLVLPVLTLTAIMLPVFLRLVRSEMEPIMRCDYIRSARAKGAGAMRLWWIHGLRNGLLPLVTIGGVQFGTLLAYTIITERVFEWHGTGFVFLEAVNRSDIPLLVTYLVFTGFLFVVINTLVDLLYRLLDPRIRLGEEGAS